MAGAFALKRGLCVHVKGTVHGGGMIFDHIEGCGMVRGKIRRTVALCSNLRCDCDLPERLVV
jgi:hypothetical protein